MPFLQGRQLSYKMFFVWVLISVYQGKLLPLFFNPANSKKSGAQMYMEAI